MEIILKEKINKIGNIGDIVKVKKGFAKNFLIPNNKALYATEQNIKLLEKEKTKLEEECNNKLQNANQVAQNINNKAFIFIRSASDAGALYGSVSAKNIADSLKKGNIRVTTHQIQINEPIKTIGTYNISIELHPDVIVNIIIVVARNNEEAENMFKSHISEKNKKIIKESNNKAEKLTNIKEKVNSTD